MFLFDVMLIKPLNLTHLAFNIAINEYIIIHCNGGVKLLPVQTLASYTLNGNMKQTVPWF